MWSLNAASETPQEPVSSRPLDQNQIPPFSLCGSFYMLSGSSSVFSNSNKAVILPQSLNTYLLWEGMNDSMNTKWFSECSSSRTFSRWNFLGQHSTQNAGLRCKNTVPETQTGRASVTTRCSLNLDIEHLHSAARWKVKWIIYAAIKNHVFKGYLMKNHVFKEYLMKNHVFKGYLIISGEIRLRTVYTVWSQSCIKI